MGPQVASTYEVHHIAIGVAGSCNPVPTMLEPSFHLKISGFRVRMVSVQCNEVAKTAAKEEAKAVVRVAKMEKAKEAARAGMMTGVTTGVMMVRVSVKKASQKSGGLLERMPELAKEFSIRLFSCKLEANRCRV